MGRQVWRRKFKSLLNKLCQIKVIIIIMLIKMKLSNILMKKKMIKSREKDDILMLKQLKGEIRI